MSRYRDVHRQLDDYIAKNESAMLEDLRSLVAIESVSENLDSADTVPGSPFGVRCREVLDQYLMMANRDGLKSEDCDGYCGTVTVGESDNYTVGIWGHLDVVPLGDDWEYPPLSLTVKDRYLIGRGVQDNKGPVVAVYYVLRFLNEYHLLRNTTVRQIVGCNEERLMKDVAWYVQNRTLPDVAFVADCEFPVCCGEKGKLGVTFETLLPMTEGGSVSGLRLMCGTAPNIIPDHALLEFTDGNGILHRLEGKGIGGHAAFPEGSHNAMADLCNQWKTLGVLAEYQRLVEFLERASMDGYGVGLGIDCEDDASGRLTCNLGTVRTENGKIICQLDIRYPVTAISDQILDRLTQMAANYGIQVTGTRNTLPFYEDPETPWIKSLTDAYEEIVGQGKPPYVMGGGTYAANLPNTVGFGAEFEQDLSALGLKQGHGNCHCPDEAESIDDLENAMRIYVNALLRIDEACGSAR